MAQLMTWKDTIGKETTVDSGTFLGIILLAGARRAKAGFEAQMANALFFLFVNVLVYICQ